MDPRRRFDIEDLTGVNNENNQVSTPRSISITSPPEVESALEGSVRKRKRYSKLWDKVSINKNFEQKMRHGMALYVAAAEQPFTFCEDIRLEYFVKTYINPAFSKVPRNTARSDTLKAFCDVRKDLISEFSKLDTTISFTLDLWSGRNGLDYARVTAYYIDSCWNLNKKIIAFRLMEFPRDANHIFQCIMPVFREYQLVNKAFCITFDNASANTAAIDMFKCNLHPPHDGMLFHMRCVYHIINLVVQDGLKHIGQHIAKIRNAILFISTSPARQQEIGELCKNYNLKPRRFRTDTWNRWNSTFLMLKSCMGYVDVITTFITEKYSGCSLTRANWETAFQFMEFLNVFYAATLAFSGVCYPTSCLVLNHLYNISFNFDKYRKKENFKAICEVMEQKFKKYFEVMPPIFMLAAAMDPRIKVVGVELLISGIAKMLVITLPSCSEIFTMLTSLYASYESKYSTKASSAQFRTYPDDPSWAFIQKIRRTTSSARTELLKYLETDYYLTENDMQNFDILNWWRTHEGIFPILSVMARDLLTPRVSSVASESAFSAGNRVLDERSSKLTPEILDCLICLKDWEDAHLGL